MADKSMSSKKIQRQHFVPKFLLRCWSNSESKIGYFRMDKPGLPFSRTGLKYAGCDRGIYSLHGVKEEDINVVEERILSPIDDKAAKVIRKVIADDYYELSADDFQWLIQFQASLELRNPRRLRELQHMAQSRIEDSVVPKLKGDRDALEYLEGHPEFARNTVLRGLYVFIINYAQRFVTELKCWGVRKFPAGKKHLLLSDFPCIRTDGLRKPHAVFALPISPRKAVLGFKTKETQQMYLNHMAESELFTRINVSSLEQAEKYIYALDDTPRRFLRNSLRSLDTPTN